MTGVRLEELRRECQAPVSAGNDVAGFLFGDHASLPITKLFVDLRLSPTYATVGFLAAGLAGSLLQASSGAIAFAGALCLVLYYVLDCVDGEVARFQGVVHVRWGYFDYLFHLLVKPLAFLGVAIGTALELGAPWMLLAAFSASISTLWLKSFLATPGILFLRDVLGRGECPPSLRSLRERSLELSTAQPSREPFKPRLDLVTLRAALTNFDVGLLLLAAACTADLVLEPFQTAWMGPLTVRALWLFYYGIALPLDFLDYLSTYLRRGHFDREMVRLLALAHRFDGEGKGGPTRSSS